MNLSSAIAYGAVPVALRPSTRGWIEQALNPGEAAHIEAGAGSLIEEIRSSRKRYLFLPASAATDQERLLILLFNLSIKNREFSGGVIAHLERREGILFYPKWKSVCFIHSPRLVAGFLDSWAFRIPTYIAVFICAKKFFWKTLSRIENLIVEAKIGAALFALSSLSPEVLRLRNGVISVVQGAYSYRWRILISLFCIRTVFSRFAFTRPIANRMSLSWVIGVFFDSRRSVWWFVWETSSQTAGACSRVLSCASSSLRNFADYAEKVRYQEQTRRAQEVWLRIIRERGPRLL